MPGRLADAGASASSRTWGSMLTSLEAVRTLTMGRQTPGTVMPQGITDYPIAKAAPHDPIEHSMKSQADPPR